MTNVSRGLVALLIATVAVFALWLVALKPSSSSNGNGGGGSLGTYQKAINEAHNAVTTSNRAAAAEGGQVGRSSAATGAHSSSASGNTAHRSSAPARPVHVKATPQERQNTVARALAQRKVIALLFYNPAGYDDRAVKQELQSVPVHAGRVVKLAVPISELSRYSVVTTQVSVTTSPTLVLVDRHAQAATIVGFADRFEIAQRVEDALAAH